MAFNFCQCEARPMSNLNTWQANKEDPYEFEACLGWQSETLFKTKQKTNIFLTSILCTRTASHGGIPPPLSLPTSPSPVIRRHSHCIMVWLKSCVGERATFCQEAPGLQPTQAQVPEAAPQCPPERQDQAQAAAAAYPILSK